MKKYIVSFMVFALLSPVFVSAHGMVDGFDEVTTGPGMMRYIEDTVLGEELHEEMEDLMVKMMSGQLTESEADRVVTLMNQYPGPHALMMNRLNLGNFGHGWGFMPWGGMMGGGSWFMWFTSLVWLVVGILLVVWLVKKILGSNK